MSSSASDKIQALFLSYEDLKAEVRKLENDLEYKKTRKTAKEKELTTMESKTRTRESQLQDEKMQLLTLNGRLKEEAEKERVEQYGVYLELLKAEDALRELEEDRLRNKNAFASELLAMARAQHAKRQELKKSFDFLSAEKKQN